jgi:hypothetical protein
MNKRIKELAKQAKLQLDQDIKDGKKDWKNTPQSYDEMVQEKFAELIVKECAWLVNENDISLPYGTFGELIKQHFGVEE